MPGACADTDLRPILWSDEGFLKALDDAGMPRDDLEASRGVYFALLDDEGQPLGYCGYEKLAGSLVLIRSCVVPRAHRGKGVGQAMMGALIDTLAAEDLRDLYLFTLDADPFFEKFGFEAIERDAAPRAVRATSQFNMECCVGVPFMRRAP